MDKCGGERNVDLQRGRDVDLYYDEPNLWPVHGNDVLTGMMVNSFCPPPIWDQNTDGLSLDVSGGLSNVRTDIDWESNVMFRGSMVPFLPDSSFIERAARFSCIPTNGVGVSGNESDEAGFSGRDVVGLSPGKELTCKKRKRNEQETEQHENDDTEPETRQKDDQNSKPGKEEYMHVRARRGQATNSHSLTERVRREKISERMKFLQDLVPGCSKVTGKAVMLDEIINYVQSLQRQVEFLSMKLATVNPRLDFNMEQFLSKDIPQARAALSSSPAAFPPHITMPFPSLHPLAPELITAGFPCNSTETLRGQINLPGSTSPVARVWEDELHNIVHMGINVRMSAPFISQCSSGFSTTIGSQETSTMTLLRVSADSTFLLRETPAIVRELVSRGNYDMSF